MTHQLTICFASDDKYAPYMGMAIFSIVYHAGAEDKFHFYILDNKISQTNKQRLNTLRGQYAFKLTYLPLDEKLFARCDTKHVNWTLSIFGRYLIPRLIPADKVLYLDCDVMVRGSLWELWQTDLDGYYLAGAPDYNVMQRGRLKERFGPDFKVEEYVNSGVLLINNKKWREEKLFETLLDYSVKNAALLQWPDQDAINFICRQHKKMLPDRYNVMGHLYKPDLFLTHPRFRQIIKEREKPVIRHFHPWKKNLFIPLREEYLALMRISPWADQLPHDDPRLWAWCKIVGRYLWRHPFCFLLPKFYKRWKYRGASCLFLDY